jgi:hypothetical protein
MDMDEIALVKKHLTHLMNFIDTVPESGLGELLEKILSLLQPIGWELCLDPWRCDDTLGCRLPGACLGEVCANVDQFLSVFEARLDSSRCGKNGRRGRDRNWPLQRNSRAVTKRRNVTRDMRTYIQ